MESMQKQYEQRINMLENDLKSARNQIDQLTEVIFADRIGRVLKKNFLFYRKTNAVENKQKRCKTRKIRLRHHSWKKRKVRNFQDPNSGGNPHGDLNFGSSTLKIDFFRHFLPKFLLIFLFFWPTRYVFSTVFLKFFAIPLNSVKWSCIFLHFFVEIISFRLYFEIISFRLYFVRVRNFEVDCFIEFLILEVSILF